MSSAFDDVNPSCYILEFSVPPGGLRLGLLCTYPTLDKVYACLRKLLLDDSELAEFGQEILELDDDITLRLWLVQHGLVAHSVDLQPFLQVQSGSPPEIDWDGVVSVLPPLEGPLIDETGIEVRLQGTPVDGFTYLDAETWLSPGFNDMEGDMEPPPELEDL